MRGEVPTRKSHQTLRQMRPPQVSSATPRIKIKNDRDNYICSVGRVMVFTLDQTRKHNVVQNYGNLLYYLFYKKYSKIRGMKYF